MKVAAAPADSKEDVIANHAEDNQSISKTIMAQKRAETTNAEQDIDQWTYWKRGLIHPHSSFRRGWDLLTTYFVLYTALVLPFQIAFSVQPEPNTAWKFKETFMDWLFIVDFFLNFATCYEHKGEIVESHGKIAKNYILTWAPIDLVSSFPFDMALVAEGGDPADAQPARTAKLARVTRVMKVVRLLRLMRAARMGRIIQKYEMMLDVNHGLFTIIVFLFKILLMAHWIGCFWFMVPTLDSFPADSWVPGHYGIEYPTGCDTDIACGEAFSKKLPSLQTQWITSFYFAITTMTTIGYGDISPSTDSEKVLALLCMMIGAGVFAYGITTFCNILENMNLRAVSYRRMMDELDEYMAYRSVPKDLKIEVRKYLAFQKDSATGCFFNEQELLDCLSDSLRKDVVKQAFADPRSGVFAKVPLFQFHQTENPLGRRFVTHALRHFAGKVFAPDDVLIHAKRVASAMFILVLGSVSEIVIGYPTSQHSDNSWFGQESCLTDRPSTCKVVCRTLCDVFWIPRKGLCELCALPQLIGLKEKLRADEKLSIFRQNCVRFLVQSRFHFWKAWVYGHSKGAKAIKMTSFELDADSNAQHDIGPRNQNSAKLLEGPEDGADAAPSASINSGVDLKPVYDDIFEVESLLQASAAQLQKLKDAAEHLKKSGTPGGGPKNTEPPLSLGADQKRSGVQGMKLEPLEIKKQE